MIEMILSAAVAVAYVRLARRVHGRPFERPVALGALGGVGTAVIQYLIGMAIMLLPEGPYRLPDFGYMLPLMLGGFFVGWFVTVRAL